MFNAHHLEAVQAIAAAAVARRAPLMLSTTMGGIRHIGLDYFVAMAGAARASVTVQLVLHRDHGADLGTVEVRIERGFDSVMIDASLASYDDNVTLVREVVSLARRQGVAVEARVGENASEEREEVAKRKTIVAEAVAFVADTDVEMLADFTPDLICAGIAKVNIDAATKAAFRDALVRHCAAAEPEIDTGKPLAEARTAAQQCASSDNLRHRMP
ncbi:MAG: class II fructose-bisphosphate aldolase [Pseudomonadota bacterium]